VPGLIKDGLPKDVLPTDARAGSVAALPDVMRGEETQLLGALPPDSTSPGPHLVVLPGTHTKWVRVEGDVVTDFSTSMTGELYGLLVRHSILGRLADVPPHPDDDAFARGLEIAFDDGGHPDVADGTDVLATLFSARTLVMTGRLEPTGVRDYISGLLIGAEVGRFTRRFAVGHRHGPDRPSVTICANPTLSPRYARALQQLGIDATLAPPDTAARGLWRTAVATGLIAKEQP
jgi:2-dehydro-3-deoxygalactonokinase